MVVKIPAEVNKIIDTLASNGHEAFVVGGCVRDSLRGVTPKDWDIATSAKPSQVMGIFPRTVKTGLKHGTVTVLFNCRKYEVTTYRIDGQYLDSRRPENVTFTSNIEEDLSRRDFTMNAIAYNPSCGFIDPFDGQGDIGRKIIRCVGHADYRFGEDALRMLRAIRFAAQLGFTVENTAIAAITARRASLANISAERIREELVRLLISPHVEATYLLETTGLLFYMFSGHVYSGDLTHIIPLLTACPVDVHLRLVIFFSWSGESCVKLLQALRFSNETIREVSLYIRLLYAAIPLDRYEIKKCLRQISRAPFEKNHEIQVRFEKLLTLQALVRPYDADRIATIRCEAQDILTKGECYTLRNLSVNGEDLAAAGIPRGKAIGDKLEELLDAVMRDPMLNDSLPSYYASKL